MARILHLNLSRHTIAVSDDEEVWSSDEIVRRLRGYRALQYAFQFADVRLHLDNLDETLSPRPLIAARMLSYARAKLFDPYGRERSLRWIDLGRAVADAIRLRFAWPAELRAIRADLQSIEHDLPRRSSGGPGVLAVRTDLWFGLEAGGAVAHTAGMLNALNASAGPLRLLSAHDIPTLAPEVERISLDWRPFGRTERTLLALNRDLIAMGQRLPRPRFVYQRFGLYGYAGLALARHWGIPLVLEYNGSEVWIGDHWGRPVPARDLALDIERIMLRSADVVTAVSRAALEQAIQRGAEPERMLLLPNAVDTQVYCPDADGAPVRARYGLNGAIVIGFIGTFGVWHGAPVLARAFTLLRERVPDLDVRLLMIGDGPERGLAERIIGEAGLGSEAVFTGLVPQVEGPVHLAAADILVSPTMPAPDGEEFFGSPTKLFEYMAMGRAIVASDMAQIAELLEHEQTALLVTPGDLDSLVQALTKLCIDAELRIKIGNAARRAAVADHNWTQRAQSLMRVMEQVS